MIKPTELRLGNCVEYDGNYYQIDSLSWDLPTVDTIEFGIGVVDYNIINPIPLTEEVLIKCGFNKLGDFKYNKGAFVIERMINGDCFLVRMYVNITESVKVRYINHLHELQNLMYAILGEDLKIDL